MKPLHISIHAISRYCERVEPVGDAEALRRLSSPAIVRAAEIGASFVKLGGGQRVVLVGGRVVTVLPKDHRPGCFDPRRDGQYGRGQQG